jgi:hypothetical protein
MIKDEHFLIKIPKLTGELEIHLIENMIEIKFKQIQMNSAEIIDSKNVKIHTCVNEKNKCPFSLHVDLII